MNVLVTICARGNNKGARRSTCPSPQFGYNNDVVEMPPERSVHVDTEWDFNVAEWVAADLIKGNTTNV